MSTDFQGIDDDPNAWRRASRQRSAGRQVMVIAIGVFVGMAAIVGCIILVFWFMSQANKPEQTVAMEAFLADLAAGNLKAAYEKTDFYTFDERDVRDEKWFQKRIREYPILATGRWSVQSEQITPHRASYEIIFKDGRKEVVLSLRFERIRKAWRVRELSVYDEDEVRKLGPWKGPFDADESRKKIKQDKERAKQKVDAVNDK